MVKDTTINHTCPKYSMPSNYMGCHLENLSIFHLYTQAPEGLNAKEILQ